MVLTVFSHSFRDFRWGRRTTQKTTKMTIPSKAVQPSAIESGRTNPARLPPLSAVVVFHAGGSGVGGSEVEGAGVDRSEIVRSVEFILITDQCITRLDNYLKSYCKTGNCRVHFNFAKSANFVNQRQ